ncbi:MAG: 4Fe-4S binding protein [Clostridiales bacterium]|nr:4Fe-4S binding protein [Clostridiales bacterium]
MTEAVKPKAEQVRIALRNCGVIDPSDINDALAHGAYAALAKALETMTPTDVVAEIKASGLRGRGGAGFPTGMKWQIAAGVPGEKKYVVCNADEGDPGAFMDRSILEGDPHSVLEAMALCGYAIGADEGRIYIRAEYPLAVRSLEHAIRQAEDLGLLGDGILGTDFNFNIKLTLGAGAFVCGEETALLHSMEGRRGEPTVKPPYPAEAGYQGKPTNVNNVETLANIPAIINKGAEWFRSIGTEGSPGTKVFALAGKINNVGLVEIPMGLTLRQIIYDIGGGIKDDKRFKAVQTGGPSGGCIAEKYLDMPIDYDNLVAIGSMMGSGGMIIMDEDDCMVSIAKYYLGFSEGESCGKCTPCRIGTRRISELLKLITDGRGTMAHIDEIKRIGQVMKDASLCALGQSAPNPVLSTMENFWDEYLAHVEDKRCPAGVCRKMTRYVINEKRCVGCSVCAKNCPAEAIEGELRSPFTIRQDKCIRCGTCIEKCNFGAISIQ